MTRWRILWATAAVVTPLVTVACGDDGPSAAEPAPTVTSRALAPATSPAATAAPASPPASTTAAATVVPRTTAAASTTTSEPRPEVPEGVLVAVITQNRPDVSANRFQIKLVNGTRERYRVASVQLAWAGITTGRVTRDPITTVVGGQRVDIPTSFPGASCSGDGTRATMPAFENARVVLELDGGGRLELPVVDEWFVARRLYEEDCERQLIESLLTIEWVGLREQEFAGRPVTAAELRVTRRAGAGTFVITEIGNTIPFTVDPADSDPPESVLVLPAEVATASAPVRFLESRCDPHALAEITQPTKFVAQVRFPDGSTHPYVVFPERDYWSVMRTTADRACVALGEG